MEKNMKLEIEELAKMSAFQSLWECGKDHLNDVIITYRADLNVLDANSKPLINKITYGDLFKNIIRTYHNLKALGVKKGDVITFASITTPEFIYTMYAAILIGAILDPLDPRSNEEDLLHHFKTEPSKLYFAPEKMFDSTRNVYGDLNVSKIITVSFMESLPKIVQIGAKIMDKKNNVAPFVAPNDKQFMSWKQFNAGRNYRLGSHPEFKREDIISFTHTSGTTGMPKTIRHTNENWNAQLYNISNSGLNFRRNDTLFNVTVPWVDFGLINVIHTFLCNGIRMDLDPTWTPEKNVDYYLKYRDNWWLGAPGWIDPLFTEEKYENTDLSFTKYIITGGAPLFEHKQVLYRQKLRERQPENGEIKGRIVQGYGMSEITAAALLDLNDDAGYLGYPMPLIDIKVKDFTTGETLKPGEEGELWLYSKSEELSPISPGYLNNEEATKTTFVTDEEGRRAVRTGDRVISDEKGLTKWLSRYKNILTYNGFNINCDMLLNAVEDIEGVAKGAIIGAVTKDGNQRPIVFVELQDGYDFEVIKQVIKETIAKKFASYYEPLDIVHYAQMPMRNMKIDYNTLKEENLNEKGEYVNEDKLIRERK